MVSSVTPLPTRSVLQRTGNGSIATQIDLCVRERSSQARVGSLSVECWSHAEARDDRHKNKSYTMR